MLNQVGDLMPEYSYTPGDGGSGGTSQGLSRFLYFWDSFELLGASGHRMMVHDSEVGWPFRPQRGESPECSWGIIKCCLSFLQALDEVRVLPKVPAGN